MNLLTTIIGKTVSGLLHLAGRNGSALPGLVVEKIDPSYLTSMLGHLPEGVVVVSGTNGKTTTTKLITSMLEAQGLRVLTNKTGSNFVRGTISTVVKHATRTGKLPYDIAVFEQDEAHAVHFVKRVKPRGVVVLNVMRDQMDRFGEIDTTKELLQKVVDAAVDWVVLNANDERVSQLKPAEGVKTYWYAHGKSLQKDYLTDDQLYDAKKAAYRCATAPFVELLNYGDGAVTVMIDEQKHIYDYSIGGSHNAINLAAALTTISAVLPNYDEKKMIAAVAKLEPAFGRGEIIQLDNGAEVTLQLVKNPAGFMHALRMLNGKKYDVVAVAINDDYADGRDVSWLWDVDFTKLTKGYGAVHCAGTRGADMANRLKYDGVRSICLDDSPESLLARLATELQGEKRQGIIFCTYTAMLKLRGLYTGSQSGLVGSGDLNFPSPYKHASEQTSPKHHIFNDLESKPHTAKRKISHELVIAHLYPKEMNIYGDTGNMVVLKRRAEWRGIGVVVKGVGVGDKIPADTDILIGGGGQDAFQGQIQEDLQVKAVDIHRLVQHDVPMLVICGTYQLFGRFFRTRRGENIKGIGVLPIETFGGDKRMIGNTLYAMPFGEVVGYENHSGQTKLDHPETDALGSVLLGEGNNPTDRFEGCRIRNVFGTYSHGPVLAKNPKFADELLRLALQRKYGDDFALAPLDDGLENLAHETAKTRPR